MKTININNVCKDFINSVSGLTSYIEKCKIVFSDDKKYLSNSYEYAAISLYKAFEHFILRLIIYCLNHDHSHVEELHNIKLGRHINDDVCEFLVTKGGYFDFKGREGVLKVVRENIGINHHIYKELKNSKYKSTIEQLCAIRNYAAHNSKQSKKKAAEAFSLERIQSAGSCFKKSGRFETISNSLINLAEAIKGSCTTHC